MAYNTFQSSSSSQMIRNYDVFVSFRGDTRYGFTDHLFDALHKKGILTFRDDQNLKKGEAIGPELLNAIEGSRVFIVVFSKKYASSTWCLRELAKIVDCLKVSTKRVLPVFYDVGPSEVRRQSGKFGKAFEKHEERFKQDLDMVQTWKRSLTQVANLSGWDVRDKPQSAEIVKIVEETKSILDQKFSSPPNDLVGWQTPVEELEKLLLLGSDDDVRVVGICGMGGIGKTTLATALYNKISGQYNAHYFVDDVSKIFGDDGSVDNATNLIRTRLRHKRVLIVLDDVDQVEQLEKLSVNLEWLGPGSRIILTTRDEHILRANGVDIVYNVPLLNHDNALQLFSRKAFKSDDIKRDYRDLTYEMLKYANGLPLAIEVLGSSLHGLDVLEWRSALASLRKASGTHIMDVLRISYDALDDMEKDIFLDIACFFVTKEETYVTKILDSRGFHSAIGIRVLNEKAFITTKNGCIFMHDLLKNLGRSIVREKSPKEPRKWSRLWDYKDFHQVMLENKASENVEAIVLDQYPKEIPENAMRVDGLSQMTRLNLLILWKIKFLGSLDHLSNELGYLYWDKYPFTCLPSSFQPDKLVELILPHSSIKQLWEGTKPLYNLRHLDLSRSKNLIKIPDFREVPNLERLNLEGCIKLVRIDPPISLLKKLVLLNLKNCKNLVSIPKNIVVLSSLEVLNLSGCSKLNLLSVEPRHEKHLQSSIRKMLMLPINFFYPRRHEQSVGLLLPSLPNFPCLRVLDLSFCNLVQIPDSIGSLHYLERLDLGGNSFVTLPCSIKKLSKLIFLNLEHCKKLKYLPELPSITALPARREHFYGNYAGLYIFNCLNLCEPERCCRMAFSWMIQVFKLVMQSSLLFHEIVIVIPGSQIPRWFNKQNVGSSISMDPSPIMHDNNWIGIACCATFVAHHDPIILGNEWQSYIRIGFHDKKHGNASFVEIPIHLGKDLVTVELDHLLLLFFTRKEFIDGYVHHDFDGTIMQTVIRPPLMHLEVKSIGYRWVFKEDLQQLNTTMLHSRKRKFI